MGRAVGDGRAARGDGHNVGVNNSGGILNGDRDRGGDGDR